MSDNVNKKLLVECITFEADPSLLKESTNNPHQPFRVTGILQRKGKKNQNGRIYPDEILIREAQKYSQTFIQDRRALLTETFVVSCSATASSSAFQAVVLVRSRRFPKTQPSSAMTLN
jgi:hypothetical protein